MGIVYKDNFKNFFQMTMFFLAYVVTFLGQLHFTRNYFFTVNPSAQQYLVRHNSYVFRAATFSEHYFLSAIILSKQLLIRSKTSTDNFYQLLVLQGSQFFRTTTIQEDKFVQDIDIYRRISFSKQNLLRNIKFFQRCIQKPFKHLRWNVFE